MIINLEPVNFNERLSQHLTAVLSSVVLALKTYLSHTQFKKLEFKEDRKMEFFSLRAEPVKSTPEEADPIDTIDKIVDISKIEGPEKENFEKRPEKEWKPSADRPAHIPTPDPSYQQPEELPVPINDWLEQL